MQTPEQFDWTPPSTARVLGMAVLLMLALLGVYHNPEKVGQETYEFALTLEQLDEQGSTDDQVQVGTQQKKLSFAALAMLGFYLAFIRRSDKPRHFNAIGWMILASLAWVATTYFWSFESPITLRESLRLFVAALVGYGIARNYSATQAVLIVLVICTGSVLLALGSELSIGYFRPWDGEHRLQGGMHANMVAVHAGFMALAAHALRLKAERKSLYTLLMAIGIFTLLVTKSRTGLAAYVVAEGVFWTMRIEPRRAAGYWAGTSVLVALLLFVMAIGGPALQRSLGNMSTMGRDVEAGSLTGRLPLWERVSEHIKDRPLLGYGYEAFWTAERREDISVDVQWYPTDAHSIYFNTVLEQGLIGASLALLLVISATWVLLRAFRTTGEVGFAFFACLLAFLLFHGLAEAGCSAARIAGLCIGAGLFFASRVAPATERATETTSPAARNPQFKIGRYSPG